MSNLFHDGGPAATGQKVMLATTAYENPDASYTFSIQRSREALHRAGIQTAYLLLSGNCHVDDARNSVVQEFLLSDCTDLVFLDADVSWEPDALVALCGYDCDIVGGVYPYRRESSVASGSVPVRMLPGIHDPDENGLIEVEGLPTGFMRIRRQVIETLSKDADSFWKGGDRRSQIPILFERSFDAGVRWGGDLNFCNKWRAAGGKVHAAYEMRLGHTAKVILRGSLGSALRRQSGTTLRHMAQSLKAGHTDIPLLREAWEYVGNPFGAEEDVLSLCAIMARQADGPIIEAGSGLTSIVMAAASKQTVFCLEHDEFWMARLQQLAREAGVKIALCPTRIVDGWYDLSPFPDLPGRFALGVNDGPPRALGDRMMFFDRLGDRVDTIVVDDADERSYADGVSGWAGRAGRRVDFVGARAALIRGVTAMHEAAE